MCTNCDRKQSPGPTPAPPAPLSHASCWLGRAARLALALACITTQIAPAPVQAQDTGTIRGRIVTATDTRPLASVLVRLDADAFVALTDSAGEFTLIDVPAGPHQLRVRNLGWVEQRREVDVAPGQTLSLLITLSAAAIELAPLEVDALSAGELTRRASGARMNVITRDRIERLEGTNTTLADLLTQNIAGVRLRRVNNYVGSPVCIEFRGAGGGGAGACNSPAVFLDGARIGNPTFLYGVIDLSTIERMEVVPPAEAGVRFGAAAQRGALLIETRRPGNAAAGRPAHAPAGREAAAGTTTWDWSNEPERHRAAAVYASSLAGGIAGVGLGILIARQCLGLRAGTQDSLVSDCAGVPSIGAGLAALIIPAAAGGLAAGIAGRTELSRGRFLPAAAGAGAMLVPGYALVMSSQRSGSSGVAWLGRAMIVLGAPLAATLADRLYRRVR